jgi:hypothetical protein
MDSSLTLTLTTGQILSVKLSTVSEATIVGLVAAKQAELLVDAEVKARTYHLGRKPTPGRGYDDRLTMRMGVSDDTLRSYLQLSHKRGGLRHKRAGKRYLVTEQAVREWLGDE